MKLADIKISRKLPFLIVSLAILSAIVTGFIGVNNSQGQLISAAKDKLAALQSSRVNALEDYLGSIKQDLSIIAKNEFVLTALYDFQDAWYLIPAADPATYLQKHYIENNPHPLGSRDALEYAQDGSDYSVMHKKYHPWFRHFLHQRGYYDVFLFDAEGNLVYTVFKEADFATNVVTGPWKDTDLANAFKAARDNPIDDKQNFFDFKPYAPSQGAPASFISQAILDAKGRLAGVVVFQMPIDGINRVMQLSAGMGETGETYLVGSDFLMRSDSRFSEESTILKTKVNTQTVQLALEGESGQKDITNYRGTDVYSAYGPLDFKGTRWAVIAEINEKEIMDPINAMKIEIIIVNIGVMIFIIIMALYSSRAISRPISDMVSSMGELAQGNFNVTIPGTARKDEIGQMAASVQVFKENGLETEHLQQEQALSEKRAEEEKQRTMEELANQFDSQVGQAIQNLASASEDLQRASNNIEVNAQQTQDSTTSVSSAVEETSANVSTVASATEEMTASAAEIAKQVAEVASKANLASSSANMTSEKVDQLNQLVENIGEVVSAIRDIAEQTNLLALNATIEAARAGEAGKGFAVVAEEVKKLATETGQKTDEIESRIADIQSATKDAVDAMQGIIHNITDIDHSSSGTASAVEEQNSVIQEITRNITQVSDASQNVSMIITDVQVAASETDQASQTLKASADGITALSDTLQQSVAGFLAQIRNPNASDSAPSAGEQDNALEAPAEEDAALDDPHDAQRAAE